MRTLNAVQNYRAVPRATVVTLLRLIAFGLPLALALSAAPAPETFVYKRVGALEIKADVYRPAATSDVRARPVVVYLHGGSLINGGREKLGKYPLRDVFLPAGFVVVSVDYRLGPESKLPAIVADVEEAFRWVREKGPALFGGDADRIIAAGGSAGGFLALVAGFRVQPRVRAIVAEMSYGDLVGAWQTRPSVHVPHYETKLGESEAWRQVSGPAIANAADRAGDGNAFNDYIRRSAQWPLALTGWDPKAEADRYRPYLPLRNVTPDYPSAFLIHGENDTDVPRSEPEQMAAEFTRHGIRHRLVILRGSEHGHRALRRI